MTLRMGTGALRALTGNWRAKRKTHRKDEAPAEIEDSDRNWRMACEQLCEARRAHLVEIRQPLLLIAQIQRSGGTLLSQLLDNHPACHAHPYELAIGYPTKGHWPRLDLHLDPAEWFEMLYERQVARFFAHGYEKSGGKAGNPEDRYPFLFLPLLQKKCFEHAVRARNVQSQRDVLDCFFASYFNAWLDNRNLYDKPKQWITAFVPGLHTKQADNVARFFADYPDGKLVSLVREPRSWYVSARGWSGDRFTSIEEAMMAWVASTRATLAARATFGERVCILRFEDLLGNTRATMRFLSHELRIPFTETLLEPTFNGMPIRANSSKGNKEYGVRQDPLTRGDGMLTAQETDYVAAQTKDLLAQVEEVQAMPFRLAA